MNLAMWNVGSLYRAGSVMTVSKEISKYNLDLVGVKEVRWDKWHQTRSKYVFFY
jgi:hypothetical protein